MKAIDYYNENHQDMFAIFEEPAHVNWTKKWASKLVKDFMAEMKQIIADRPQISDKALHAVVKEQNQKWNSLALMLKTKHGISPIRHDGFIRFLEMASNSRKEKQS